MYTAAFPDTPLYGYYNPLQPASVTQAEDDLLQLIEQEGPFDGVLAYSGGTALAAQIIIRDSQKNAFSLPEERPFRFAIFINGVTPLKVIPAQEVRAETLGESHDPSLVKEEVSNLLLRDSATRVRKKQSEYDTYDPAAIKQDIALLESRVTIDGRPCLSNGIDAITRYHVDLDGVLIDIPTLHVRCLEEVDEDHGLNLTKLCDPESVTEYFHRNGEDFPRGHAEMKRIAQLIRGTAERA